MAQRSLAAFSSLLAWFGGGAVTAQTPAELPPIEQAALPGATGGTDAVATCLVQKPLGWQPDTWAPLLVLWPGDDRDAAAGRRQLGDVGAPASRAGYVVVLPLLGDAAGQAPDALTRWLRATFRIEQGAMHAAAVDAIPRAVQRTLAQRHQFQSFTALTATADDQLAPLQRLPLRRVTTLANADAAARESHFTALHAARRATGAAHEVAQALDDFHDAAANGDEARYFARLPDDAVFLGTDARERWTGAEFRRFAMPYFQRPEAWTYVALQRHVRVGGDGAVAWFDEALDNDAYGECRGSGVLVRRDGRWVLQHYDLTIPIPNDLAGDVASRIRKLVDGDAASPAPTVVLLVRHAEKVDASTDAALSERGRERAQALLQTLRDVPIDAVFHTEFQRTAATVAPLCEARGLRPEVVRARTEEALLARLREMRGRTVLVCGHSNTVPALIDALGASGPAITDDEFDGLFVVVGDGDGAKPRLLKLRYGAH